MRTRSYYRNEETLKCFDHTLYTYTSSETDRLCIAPTKAGRRCPWDISEEELEEAVDLKLEAEGLQPGNERNAVLQRLVLARVCGDAHRIKLEADPVCLGRVAEMYGREIPVPSSEPRQAQQSPRASRASARRSSSVMTNYSGQVRHRYLLRPRLAGPSITDPTNSTSTSGLPIFVPYPSDPNDHINDVLVSDIPHDFTRDGHVYIFTWPSSPEFVKIGYTSQSVASRISAWQECNPGATLLVSKSFTFPFRMERLIHLQMAKARHQIIICKKCMSTHLEWFKVSAQEAIQVISDWEKLVAREVLYTSTGHLTERWRNRIASMKDEVTAGALLDVLDTETKQLKEDARTVTVPVIEVDKLEEKTPAIVEAQAVMSSLDLSSSKTIVSTPASEKLTQETQDQILSIFNDFMLMLAQQVKDASTADTREAIRGHPGVPSLLAAAVAA